MDNKTKWAILGLVGFLVVTLGLGAIAVFLAVMSVYLVVSTTTEQNRTKRGIDIN